MSIKEQDNNILSDGELAKLNIESHAALEFIAENHTKLFTTIAYLQAERDEYKRRYQNMIDIYQPKS
jgi:hypothetical protein